MSYALTALVLLACDTRRGEWVSLHAMQQRIQAPAPDIQRAAEQLAACGQLAHATHAGHPYWGTGVEGVACTAATAGAITTASPPTL